MSHSRRGGDNALRLWMPLSLDNCGVPFTNNQNPISALTTMALKSGHKVSWSTDGFTVVLSQGVTFCHCSTLLTEAVAHWKLGQQNPKMWGLEQYRIAIALLEVCTLLPTSSSAVLERRREFHWFPF